MSYEAIVARISTRPHPKADRLQLGTCCGHQVVVGLDTQDGELGVFFPTDGQLSDEFVKANSIYSKSAKDKLGISYLDDEKHGFFSERRRVRAQSFRGEKSDGFWCPLSYFCWTDVAGFVNPPTQAVWYDSQVFTEGKTFTHLGNYEICQKYETPATKSAQANKIGRHQRENRCFPKHDVTKKFQYVADKIPADAVIWITEKLHGTSGRYGYVLDDIDLSIWKRLWNKFMGRAFRAFPVREYRYLNGSKNVILEKTSGAGYYGTNDFRYKAIEGVTLKKGEVVYFEIVGDYKAGKPIMGVQPIGDELKDVRKQYGEFMRYSYGQQNRLPGEPAIYVYKILHMNEDGEAIDLSWPQVKARCKELALKYVPELRSALTLQEQSLSTIGSIVAELTEGPSTLDSSHIREGVVLRVESTEGIDYIKNKSWIFGVLEGYIKDSDSYVDTEEAA